MDIASKQFTPAGIYEKLFVVGDDAGAKALTASANGLL